MKAVYAGSFDPITFGHRNVIEAAAALFEELIVLVAVHPTKSPLFSVEDRLAFIRLTVAHLARVSAASYEGYTVEYARSIGATYLVRGVRDGTDAAYETTLARINRELAPEVSTIFIPADTHLAEVSSSGLKQRASRHECIRGLCHPEVEVALRNKSA